MIRHSATSITSSSAAHIAGTVRKLEPIGVTVPRKILEAVTLAEQRIPALEAQRLEVTAMVGNTGPGFATTVAEGELTADQILARLVGADLEASKVNTAFDAAKTAVGRTLRDALADHREKWIPTLRTVIEDRAEACYDGVYNPDGLDYKHNPHGADYALQDDATALAWGELNTLWTVVTVLHNYGILPHHGRRACDYLFSSPAHERGDSDHLDFTRFIIMCREEHEPSLYTEAELQAFEVEHAEHGTPARPRDRYTASTGYTRTH